MDSIEQKLYYDQLSIISYHIWIMLLRIYKGNPNFGHNNITRSSVANDIKVWRGFYRIQMFYRQDEDW